MNKPFSWVRPDGIRFDYNGSLTVNVYRNGQNIDCFTLGYFDKHTVRSITGEMNKWVDWSLQRE